METETSDSEAINEAVLDCESTDSYSAAAAQDSECAQSARKRLRHRRRNGGRGGSTRDVPPNQAFTISPSSK